MHKHDLGQATCSACLPYHVWPTPEGLAGLHHWLLHSSEAAQCIKHDCGLVCRQQLRCSPNQRVTNSAGCGELGGRISVTMRRAQRVL